MKTFTKILFLTIVLFTAVQTYSQDIVNQQQEDNKERIIELEKLKDKVKTNERELLKKELLTLNKDLENGIITEEQAEDLKKEKAKNRARNIENRVAIIDNKIELLERNQPESTSINLEEYEGSIIKFGNVFTIGSNESKKVIKYDTRTTSDLVLALGFNNVIVKGESFEDSPYKIGGSRFFEIGWAWKTRLLKNSNAVRFKYGFSFMINGLKPTDNRYFVEENDNTALEEFPVNLSKSKLSITNLVFPVHFEFGPSRKVEKDSYVRYYTNEKVKFGIGGFAGFNVGTRQKLKYKEDGERVKDKIKRDFNTSNLVYGLSAYVGWDNLGLYAKYDLSPIFKNQVTEQNNVSLGLRFDLD